MTWTELDARPEPMTTPRPSASDLARRQFDHEENERSRISKRESIRQKIALAALADERRQAIVASLEAESAKLEQLADAHVLDCAPLQEELSRIEGEQVARIKQRQPTDAAGEQRRRQLIDEISTRTTALEAAVEAQKRILERLEAERIAEAKNCDSGALKAELFETAPAHLQIAVRVAHSTETYASRRLAAANEQRALKSNPYIEAELATAQAELERARAIVKAAMEACYSAE